MLFTRLYIKLKKDVTSRLHSHFVHNKSRVKISYLGKFIVHLNLYIGLTLRQFVFGHENLPRK